MDNRPVGIFDSGLGGLTAVREFKKLLPHENIIYFGDTGRMPYGARPAGQIRVIAGQNLAFVAGHGTKAMIAACARRVRMLFRILSASLIVVISNL